MEKPLAGESNFEVWALASFFVDEFGAAAWARCKAKPSGCSGPRSRREGGFPAPWANVHDHRKFLRRTSKLCVGVESTLREGFVRPYASFFNPVAL